MYDDCQLIQLILHTIKKFGFVIKIITFFIHRLRLEGGEGGLNSKRSDFVDNYETAPNDKVLFCFNFGHQCFRSLFFKMKVFF